MMRTQTTFALRNLIFRDMDPTTPEMNEKEIEAWQQNLPLVRDEIIGFLDFIVGSIFYKGVLRRQVYLVQTEITALLNRIARYENLSGPVERLRDEAVACLGSVMERLTGEYKKYLNIDSFLPLLHLKKEQRDLTAQITLVQASFLKHGINRKLRDLVLEPINHLCNVKKCSYRDLDYIREFMVLFADLFLDEQKTDRCDTVLVNLLTEANFNTRKFMEHLKDGIRAELSELYEVRAQFDLLYDHQRQFERSQLRRHLGCFDTKRRKTKDVMLEFIRTEIRCLENKENLRAATLKQAAAVTAVLPARTNTYRIQTTLSVDALAYLFRLLVGADIIEAKVKTELLAFVADIFHTPGMPAGGISPGSLGTKYKQVVQSTATKVRAALKKMLKQLDQDFCFD